jgi:hypothetical protein
MMTYYVSKTTDTKIINDEVKYIIGPKTTEFFKKILSNLNHSLLITLRNQNFSKK